MITWKHFRHFHFIAFFLEHAGYRVLGCPSCCWVDVECAQKLWLPNGVRVKDHFLGPGLQHSGMLSYGTTKGTWTHANLVSSASQLHSLLAENKLLTIFHLLAIYLEVLGLGFIHQSTHCVPYLCHHCSLKSFANAACCWSNTAILSFSRRNVS